MKRILPLILALVAGMAQADSNSDYRVKPEKPSQSPS